MIQFVGSKGFYSLVDNLKKDRNNVPEFHRRIKFNSLTKQLSVVTNLVAIFCFYLTSVSSAHSFINSHININSVGGDGDSFFEDDVSTGISMCLPNYEVSEGSIIRTKDSQDLGARFLNESDLGVTGREDCLRLCCRTPRCNVAVFEEKNSGSCYMFDCGSPEDFRCKFTSQIHYMSAILRRKEVQVPANIQQHTTSTHNNGNNQHETELSQLRIQMTESENKDNGIRKSLPVSGRLDVNNDVLPKATTSAPGPLGNLENNSRRCSRWQFECKSSGECIAIYNACDGIPNCEDASDEGPELHCPSSVVGGSVNNPQSKGSETQQPLSPLTSGGLSADKVLGMSGNSPILHPPASLGQEFSAGKADPQQSTLNGNNDHIFNHKSGGIMEQNYGSQLQQQKHTNNPFWKPQQSGYDYGTGEQFPNNAFGQGLPPGQQIPNSYVGNNNNYGVGPASYPYVPGYSGQPQQNNPQLQVPLLPYNNPGNNNNFNLQNPPPQTQQQYYGNNIIPANTNVNGIGSSLENGNGHQQLQNPVFSSPSRTGVTGSQAGLPIAQKPLGQIPATLSTTAPITDSKSKPVTIAPPQAINGNSDANKVSDGTSSVGTKVDSETQLEDEILKSLKNQPYNSETAAVHLEELTPHKAGPAAFLLFILGLAMSIVMAIIVGCRLRRFSTRRRRKNRLDPDYLVDGMYL